MTPYTILFLLEGFMNLLNDFKEFVMNNYDINNALILEKYEHSIRVYFLMMKLAQELKLNNRDTYLAMLIGLFHDLGRFEEVVRHQKFARKAKFDHGAYSNKILFNDHFIDKYHLNEEELNIVRKAIYFHNKNGIGENLNERETLFAKMIRDIDKLDILYVFAKGHELDYKKLPNANLLEDFYLDNEVQLKDVKNQNDLIMYYLGWLNTLYFEESHRVLANTKEYKDIYNLSPYLNKEVINKNNLSLVNIFYELCEYLKNDNIAEGIIDDELNAVFNNIIDIKPYIESNINVDEYLDELTKNTTILIKKLVYLILCNSVYPDEKLHIAVNKSVKLNMLVDRVIETMYSTNKNTNYLDEFIKKIDVNSEVQDYFDNMIETIKEKEKVRYYGK